MSDAFWRKVEQLFAEASAMPPDERDGWLDGHGLDAGLRAEVDALLRAHDESGSFLAGRADDASHSHARSPVGRTIGGFRLLEPVGEGGMGVVYRAERVTGGFTQRVAFKLVHGILRTADAVRRFVSERQILASLTHPHIVMLLDGGITEQGEAYLVMEYVDGVPISTFCRTERLGLDQRLMLMRQVCSAVQHAHQHGVVHRDLKPGNILVTADGVPKVLDFGIAKVVTETGRDDTVAGAAVRLTPNYASPEQLRGLPVTISSDIYSLGVVLYEMVTGQRPRETDGVALDVVLAQALSEQQTSASQAAEQQRETLPYAAARLKGDLDVVIAKATSGEPSQRYSSADELSADLGRVLAGEPITARAPSFWYLTSKLARRHPVAVAASAVSLVALIVALGVSVYQIRVATRERDRAEQRFTDLRQLANALIFRIHDGVAALPGSLEVRRAIVNEALTYLEKLSADPNADPELQLELARGYHRVGAVQGRPNASNLGDRPGAIRSLRKSVDLLEGLVASPQPSPLWRRELVSAQVSLAETLAISGSKEEGLAIVERAVGRARQLVDAEPSDGNRSLLGATLFQFAMLVERDRAIDAWTNTLSVYRALLDEKPDSREFQRNVALVHKYLGARYADTGDLVNERLHQTRALELDRRRLDAAPDDRSVQFDVAIDLANLGTVVKKAGQHEEALRYFEQSLALRQRVVDSDGNDVQARGRLAYGHRVLADEYLGQHNVEVSLQHARAAVRIGQTLASLDPFHQEELSAELETLGRVVNASGDRPQACRIFESSSAIVRQLRSSGSGPQNDRLAKLDRAVTRHLQGCPQAISGR